MYARNPGDSEYIEPFGEVGVRVGARRMRQQKPGCWTYPRDAAEAARNGVRVKRHLPRSCDRNRDEQGLGNTLAKRLNVSPEEQLKGFLNSILQGRGQTAMEIAQAALFLCSDFSSAISRSIN